MIRRTLLFLALLLVGGCPKPAAAPPQPVEVDAGHPLPRTHLDVEGTDGRSFGLEAELALTDPDRERGLMFRRTLADTEGMLFVFREASPHNFWMKNTLIPLDMLFIDANSHVLGVVANAEPLTLSGRSVPGDSLYVLEVAGGWCAARGIGPGAMLHFAESARFPVE
jgi:uncharacterized membrane protein (UPF0127 family)